MTYLGNKIEQSVAYSETEFTATASQTTFNAAYDVGFVDVFMNGLKLSDTEYTATDGTSVVLDVGAEAGDIIVIKAYSTFSIADTYSQAEIDGMLGTGDSIDEKVSRYAVSATTYNTDGSLATMTYSTGNKSLYTYTTGTLTSIEYTDTDGSTVLLTVGFTYNADGTLATITRS